MAVHYYLVERLPTVEEYRSLCTAVGWQEVMNFAVADAALANSIYGVVAMSGEHVVGMGRIVGDGAIYYYIQDIAVHPDYQHNGIGKSILDRIFSFLLSHAPERAFIGLFAAEGTVPFYERYGLKDYAPAMTGMFTVVERNDPGEGMNERRDRMF